MQLVGASRRQNLELSIQLAVGTGDLTILDGDKLVRSDFEHIVLALHQFDLLVVRLVEQIRWARIENAVHTRAAMHHPAEPALVHVEDCQWAKYHAVARGQLDNAHAVVLGLRKHMAALGEQHKLLVSRVLALAANAVRSGEMVLWHLQDHLVAELAVVVNLVVNHNARGPVIARRDECVDARRSENVLGRGDVVTKHARRNCAAAGHEPSSSGCKHKKVSKA
mmetsp:Transcript_28184/g.48288  ORF Transcript_28184/g.48288 Transcript_28184/m.48288 type:complete len:223 (+) Transcript_28184:1035-1703(+)